MSHPTQYHSPWFRELAALPELELEVLYCFRPDAKQQGKGFGVAFEWDISLLDGYNHRFLTNVAKSPGFHFSGCDTPEILRVIAAARYDVFLVNGWNVRSYWQAMRACRMQQLPMMIRGDSHLLKSRSMATRIVKRLTLGRWLPRFDAFLTVGLLNESYYKQYGADPARFFPVRHFVDNAWFAARALAAAPRLADLRRSWGLPKNAFVVLFAAKFIDFKRPMDAITALEMCAGTGMHLLMVGDGPLREGCERYARQRNLPVSFAGFLNQQRMPDAYAVADVLLLPSSASETWGLVVNEAMACGVPAIVTDQVGCAPDLIEEGETGAVFPVGDRVALASLLRKYAESPGQAVLEGKQALARVASYNVKSAAQQTLLASAYAIARHARNK